jgi:hypothetical protein
MFFSYFFNFFCQVSFSQRLCIYNSIYQHSHNPEQMKKAIVFVILLASFSFAANAQSTKSDKNKQTAKTEQAPLKDHVCTSACSNGNHVYTHGEKGHTCTAACAETKSATGQMDLKDHVCTSACNNGKHIYAHGEKGHVCTDACKKL